MSGQRKSLILHTIPVKINIRTSLIKEQYMPKRIPLIAGNWKMFKTRSEAKDLAFGLKLSCADVTGREILICPPYTAIEQVAEIVKTGPIALGAQNMHWESKGAFTGEVAPGMLVDVGVKYVIVGHSERRQYFAETNETVNKKMKAAVQFGIIPIVCIGETLNEREANRTLAVISLQVRNGMEGLSNQQAGKIVIAYEPVWAIGTGKTATAAQAEEAHAYIRKLFSEMYGADAADSVRILYGGSMKPDNVSDLMSQPDIDGGLVGGASLEVESFTKIVKYAVK
jgi:triosephosphate isomerase